MSRRPKPLYVGIANVGLTLMATAWYLSSIEMDDGLEALVALPLFGATCATTTAVGTVRGGDPEWAFRALSATVLVTIVAAVIAALPAVAGGADPGPALGGLAAVAWIAFWFALAGVGSGFGVGRAWKAVRGHAHGAGRGGGA